MGDSKRIKVEATVPYALRELARWFAHGQRKGESPPFDPMATLLIAAEAYEDMEQECEQEGGD